MAEEPIKKTEYNPTPLYPSGICHIILQVGWACFLLVMSSAIAADQSDLSLPLWGGAISSVGSSSQQGSFSTKQVKLHHFDEIPCGSCHAAPGTNVENTDWKMGVDVNLACTSLGCHNYDEKMNHPLDVPSPVRSTNQSQTMTCLSCHQPQESDSVDTNEDRILQDSQTIACESCHQRLGGTLRQQSHWKFSQKAHLVSLTPGMTSDKQDDSLMEFAIGDIDMESNTCLSCHDEVTVTIPAMNETPMQKAQRFRSMTDHPIGMNYQYILSQNPMYFKSLMGKENQIRMFDGKVGCGSCHSLYSDIPSNLTAEYKGSVLCRTCHNR